MDGCIRHAQLWKEREMSFRVTLNCQLKPNQYDQLLPFLEENLPNVRGFSGCMKVAVYIDEEQSEMLLEEEWLSVEKHQNYLGFIENNGVLKKLSAFLRQPPQIRYFRKVEV
jgi:quinol monooxygenase YgiN